MSVADNLKTIAENTHKVWATGRIGGYNNGYDVGKEEGIEQGIEQGKQAENEAFWNCLIHDQLSQLNSAFKGWEPEIFKPTKVIQVKQSHATTRSMSAAFKNFGARTPKGVEISLPKIFEKYGGGLNTKYAYDLKYLFQYSNITDAGTIDLSTITGQYITELCRGAKRLKRIVLANVTATSLAYSNTFLDCISLEELYFENSIISQNINLYYCKCNPDSMKSIINSLSNFSGTENEFVYTVIFPENCWAALEADSVSPNGNSWREYVFDKGWNS